jgi:predicted nucleotidyltransferase
LRLSQKEIDTIKFYSNDIFGQCNIYIFGSRVDDTKKGGDIDIFIEATSKSELFKKKIKLKSKLENILYKPIDIVVSRDKNRLIEQEALRGIKL